MFAARGLTIAVACGGVGGGGLSCTCAFNAGMLSSARDVGLNAVYPRRVARMTFRLGRVTLYGK